MYTYKKGNTTTLEINTSVEGEPIETKIERIVNNNEPITDGAPLIYTERKDGVIAGYDVRTDRWEIAIEAMDKVQKAKIAKREERHKPEEGKEGKIIDLNEKKPPESGTESGA